MNHNINDNALKYLRKQHKDWSEDKIKAEGEKMCGKNAEDNGERLELLFFNCIDERNK